MFLYHSLLDRSRYSKCRKASKISLRGRTTPSITHFIRNKILRNSRYGMGRPKKLFTINYPQNQETHKMNKPIRNK